MLRVRRATTAEYPQLATVLARAFHDDPFWRWMTRSGTGYTSRLEQAFLSQLHYLTESAGLIHTLDGTQAAALWSPPGTWGNGTLARLRFLPDLVRLCGARRLPARLHGIRRAQALHPQPPHFYLQILGVSPAAQRKGHARLLMETVLAQCDRSGFSAYLETCNPDNVDFYRHFGFTVHDTMMMPDRGPRVWCMLRPGDRRSATAFQQQHEPPQL